MTYLDGSHRGLLALGDSVTRGRGMVPSLRVAPLSWAQWLAEALDMPFRNLAVDGARAADVVAEQLPRAGRGYDIAALYVGVNDARSVDFDADGFRRDVDTLLDGLAEGADRLLVLTIPRDLGRPPAGEDVLTANGILRAAAGRSGAILCELDDFGGWTRVLPDAVHPTALGQLAIAQRAAEALAAEGVAVPRQPVSLVEAERGPRALARYAPWYGRRLAADLWRRALERRRYRHEP